MACLCLLLVLHSARCEPIKFSCSAAGNGGDWGSMHVFSMHKWINNKSSCCSFLADIRDCEKPKILMWWYAKTYVAIIPLTLLRFGLVWFIAFIICKKQPRTITLFMWGLEWGLQRKEVKLKEEEEVKRIAGIVQIAKPTGKKSLSVSDGLGSLTLSVIFVFLSNLSNLFSHH